MKKHDLIVFAVCILNTISCYGNSDKDTVDVGGYIKNLVSKNILIYRMYYLHNYVKSEYLEHNFLQNRYVHKRLFSYLPDDNCKLNIHITRAKVFFPDSNYVLYEVIKDQDSYHCDSYILDQDLFPYNNNDDKFLIAFNIKDDYNILYLSGNFFQDRFFSFFENSNLSIKKNILNYLELRLFSLDYLSIDYYKATRKYYYYTITLSNTVNKIKVKVEKTNPDNIQLIRTGT